VKYLLTMNMPSAQNYLVHQITVEHEVEDCADFCELLNQHEFITCRLLYRKRNQRGETVWQDRGDMVLNSAHIGKVQLYIEREEYNDDEAYGNFGTDNQYAPGARGPIRPRRGVL